MRLTSKGQVTIPLEIRERLGLLPGTEVEFSVVGDSARIRKSARQHRGRALVQHVRGTATARRGLTTNQIMALTRGE
jgi:AbrB family looped-hinge helix DNA binding protein